MQRSCLLAALLGATVARAQYPVVRGLPVTRVEFFDDGVTPLEAKQASDPLGQGPLISAALGGVWPPGGVFPPDPIIVHMPTPGAVGVSFPYPLILLLHGAQPSATESAAANVNDVARRIASYGYVVVAPWHRIIDPSIGALVSGIEPSSIVDTLVTVEDWNAGATPLASFLQGRVDMNKIGIMAHSLGAGAAISAINSSPGNCNFPYCSAQSGINFLPVLQLQIPPPADFSIPARFVISSVATYGAFYVLPQTPLGTPPNIINVPNAFPDTSATPVFILYGTLDGVTPPPLQQFLFSALTGARGLLEIEGINHGQINDVPLPRVVDLPPERTDGFARYIISLTAVRAFDAYLKAFEPALDGLCGLIPFDHYVPPVPPPPAVNTRPINFLAYQDPTQCPTPPGPVPPLE